MATAKKHLRKKDPANYQPFLYGKLNQGFGHGNSATAWAIRMECRAHFHWLV